VAARFDLLASGADLEEVITMDQLRRQVGRVYARLLVQRWFLTAPWTLTAGLTMAALGIAVDKLYPLGVPAVVWLSLGAALGLVAAVVWVAWTRRGPLDAAIELDRRFALKERVSSVLALDAAALASPAGQALLRDACEQASALDVREHFGLRPSRWSLLPLLPAAGGVALALFVGSWSARQATATIAPVAVKQQVREARKQLQKKLAELPKIAKKEGLGATEQELKKLEQAIQRSLDPKQDLDKKQALLKLNDLSQELQRRRSQMIDSQSLKRQLDDLKNLQRGPADKFAQALKQGNLKQALEELERLKQELADGKLDQPAQEQLARQLEGMRQTLDKMAQAQEQAKEQLKRQIAEKRAAGKNGEADELQRQLDDLQQQSRQARQLEGMAQKFGQCAKCLRQGDANGARQQLEEMQGQLGELQQELAESDLLEQALDDIAQAKDAMNCSRCGGRGCAACQGLAGRNGQALGRGQGQGPRPEEAGPTSAYDSAVKQKLGRGSAMVVDRVAGPNLKGGVQQEIATQFQEARNEAANPLTGQRLPKASQEQAKEYFDSLREGK
jgi:hypothetical protein